MIGHMEIKLANAILHNMNVIVGLPSSCMGYTGFVTFLSHSTGKIYNGYQANGDLRISQEQDLDVGIYGVFFCYLTS